MKNDCIFSNDEPIICIDDSRTKFPQFRGFQFWIEKGLIYHVRHIYPNDDIVHSILLKELENIPVKIPLLQRLQEPAFAEFRFRKLTEEEKEIYAQLPLHQIRGPIRLIVNK